MEYIDGKTLSGPLHVDDALKLSLEIVRGLEGARTGRGKTGGCAIRHFHFRSVFYEMLSGSRAFPGDSTAQALSAVLRDEPAPLAVSAELQKVGEQGFWMAVVPFKCSGACAELPALAEGLTEDIVAGLSWFSYLRVLTKESAGIARYVIEGSLRQTGSLGTAPPRLGGLSKWSAIRTKLRLPLPVTSQLVGNGVLVRA
jgi:hypothetical protein